MYGTTMKSFNTKGSRKKDKEKKPNFFSRGRRKDPKMSETEIKDTTYMKIDPMEDTVAETVVSVKKEGFKESFSIKDFPIASVVITAILTMLMIVLTTGFNI